MFVPNLRCLPQSQGVPPAYPVWTNRPRTRDGSTPAHPGRWLWAGRPRTRCGRDARAPRAASHLRTRCGRDTRVPRLHDL